MKRPNKKPIVYIICSTLMLAAALAVFLAVFLTQNPRDAAGPGQPSDSGAGSEQPSDSNAADSPEKKDSSPLVPADSKSSEPVMPPSVTKTPNPRGSILIAIDAGHQKTQNSSLEPIGPNAKEKKPKVSSGTAGSASGLAEYQLTLQVAKKLEKALKQEGYQVIMTRKSHNVNISNRERAAIANDANADAFIRIHADGSDNASAVGAMTICPTKNSPYCPQIYKKSRKLSQKILKGFQDATGCKSRGVWETDTMSGINWCEVPVTILEMGFMSNREEDLLMASKNYQKKMVDGIVQGVNDFFE